MTKGKVLQMGPQDNGPSQVTGNQPTPEQIAEMKKRTDEFKKMLSDSLDIAKAAYISCRSMELYEAEYAVFSVLVTMNELSVIMENRKPIEGMSLADVFFSQNSEMTIALNKKCSKLRIPSVGDYKALHDQSIKLGASIYHAHIAAPPSLKDEFLYAMAESNRLRILFQYLIFDAKSNSKKAE